jgi:bifunctional oligoribonuclease and PAP phosphatase NrnA
LSYLNFDKKQLSRLLNTPSKVVITTHYNPDGDAIGSSLALYHILRKLAHNVSLLVPNDLPGFLKWMPGSEDILIYQNRTDECNKRIEEAEIIFSVDYNAFSRVKFFQDKLLEAGAKKVLIDHHPKPERTFDAYFSETGVSSTSELIYHLVRSSGLAGLIDADIASCLFVGIMTDTGSFSYSCRNPELFEVTAQLIRRGIDVENIHRLVYDTYSESRMRLLGFCLSNRMKVLPEYNTAYMWLTKEDLEQFGYQPGDTEGVVNYPLSIENITMSALFMERYDRVRISLRSKNDFSVNEIARKHFIGGGHKNAAGADSFQSIEQTIIHFESILPAYKQELSANSVGNFQGIKY